MFPSSASPHPAAMSWYDIPREAISALKISTLLPVMATPLRSAGIAILRLQTGPFSPGQFQVGRSQVGRPLRRLPGLASAFTMVSC